MSEREISASHFADDIKDLLACLVSHKVDFMLMAS